MPSATDYRAFENYCRQMIGMTFAFIRYAELRYDLDSPIRAYTTSHNNLHTVDEAIEFITADNRPVSIFWDDRFYHYGIGVLIDANRDVSSFQVWDLTADGQEIHLIFSNYRKIIIGAAEMNKPETSLYEGHNNLLVTDDESLWDKLKKHADKGFL